ncbi:ketoacyl-ACP synthase III [bacterium]|nr:ketoacyl-ACP synthase III [bacterium]
MKCGIKGIGVAIPEKIVTNDDLTKLMNTSDEWITTRTGIKQRHHAAQGVFCSDLGAQASVKAVESAGIKMKDIDLILFCTLSPDLAFPGTGVYTQAKLGLEDIPAMDIRNQCCGFLYGLKTGVAFVEAGHYKNILLIGAEIQSSALDFSDKGRDVAVLFGDAGAAVVLSACKEDEGIDSVHIHADGKGANYLRARVWDISQKPFINLDKVDDKQLWPEMDGKQVFFHAISRLPEAVNEALEFNGLTVKDIDLYIFHQANLRINEYVRDFMDIPHEKVFNNIQYRGNTSAASIPLCLYDAQQQGILKKGHRVMLAGFGSGFTWGSSVLQWDI